MENNQEPTMNAVPPSKLSETPPHARHTVLISILVLGILVIALFAGWIFFGKSVVLKKVQKMTASSIIASPTPMPFADMTIPFLRARQYTSALEPKETVNSYANYTSYLTSYDSDGNKVNALLTIPTGEEPAGGWSAVVFIHGYIPPTLYTTIGPQYADYVDYLARNGFVVLKIDLRGHGKSQGEAGGGYYGSDYVIDALNAYAALEATDYVNAKEIGMWGHSMAGNILMRSFAAKPTIPAVVIWAGAVYSYSDMQKYGITDNSYRPPTNVTRTQQKRRELFEKQGSPSATSEFWQQVAPTNYLSDLQGAIEIHHAVDDDVVDIGYSRDLMSLLDTTTVEHKLYEYPSGGHNISGSSFNEAMQRTVDFYKAHLTL